MLLRDPDGNLIDLFTPPPTVGDRGRVGGAPAPSSNPAGQAHLAHEALDGAAGDRDALPVELAPHLAGAVDAVVLLEHPGDGRPQLGVADPSPAGRAGPGRVVGGGGDLERL